MKRNQFVSRVTAAMAALAFVAATSMASVPARAAEDGAAAEEALEVPVALQTGEGLCADAVGRRLEGEVLAGHPEHILE